MPESPPPESRTVGQLVAETIRLYRERFWRALPLGVPLAAVFFAIAGRTVAVQVVALWVAAPLLAATFAVASGLAARVPLTTPALARATAAGTLAFLPAPVLMTLFLLPALAWLALFGLAVPVAVIEGRGVLASLARARELGRADYVHALGALATLVIVFVLTALVLGFLLQGQAEQTARIAGFLAVVVLSPLLFLGASLLYFDQEARLRSR